MCIRDSVTARHSSSGRQPNLHLGSRNGITELSQRAPPIFGWAAITWASAHILVFGRPFVKRFARCYQTVVCPVLCCPVCLSVTLAYCGQTVGWIKIKLGMQVGLNPGHTVLDGDPAPPTHRGTASISAHICCGQMAGWIKMSLGREVGLAQATLC